MAGIYLKLKELTDTISEEIKNEVININKKICIASVIAGDDPSCISYLKGMKKKADKLGMDIDIIQLEENINKEDFLSKIEELNKNQKYSGLIVQIPLPKQIDLHSVALKLDHKKDIDGITPFNQGLLFNGNPFLVPATALAVDLSLKFISKKFDFPLMGKNAVIIGRSITVGKPTALLFLQNNITPTIVHTKTKDTANISLNADIVVASCGVPEFIKEEWIKKDAVVLDVGIHAINECSLEGEDSCRLSGDVDQKSALKKAKILTAVPGGIGNVTSVLIFANAVKSWYKINKDKDFKFKFEI